MAKLYELLATFGGLGYAPIAPGTFGTLGGVALAALFGWTWPEYYLPLCLGFAAFFTVLGKPCGDWAEKRFGRKDPGAFVLDEVAGYLVTVAWIEFYGWQQLVAAFFLFRLFDIWKPPPARRMEKLPGGLGIMIDDIVAGLWALAIMAGLYHWAPNLMGLPAVTL
jgi:phosphatidylglycerophosphatase A